MMCAAKWLPSAPMWFSAYGNGRKVASAVLRAPMDKYRGRASTDVKHTLSTQHRSACLKASSLS